jgi:hypothetical protein
MTTDPSRHPKAATHQTDGEGAGGRAHTQPTPSTSATGDMTKTSVGTTRDPTDTSNKGRSPGWRSLGAIA